ncbi:MAG TPA: hypothetical protein VHX49_11495 [Candidatus Acidoferrales bacterium]|jgi:hypothetical protein|nr:hypothetical protein [Candidatus Acidoferrales bacterium]
MAVLGSAALLQAEIDAGLEVFKLLEPEVQKGFVALFHSFHHKQNQLNAAQDALRPPQPKPNLSSTSLDASIPSTS